MHKRIENGDEISTEIYARLFFSQTNRTISTKQTTRFKGSFEQKYYSLIQF